jgi:ribokinase
MPFGSRFRIGDFGVITVFGSINFDLIGGVGRLPRPGETVPGTTFVTAPGGKGANQALAAARAGGSVRMAGAVGKDEFATPALNLLRSGGVDLARVKTVEGPTGVALILVESGGENVIAVIPGANGTVNAADAAALQLSASDTLVLQLEVPVASIEVAALRARQAGALVLLNYAPFRADALGVIPHATHLVVNETECGLIAAALELNVTEPSAQAAALAEKFGAAVIVTLGREGALAVSEGRTETVSALPVTAIDTVGAGDTFCGYLAVGLSEGRPLKDALVLASTAASLACTKAGAQPSIPLRPDVDAALMT